MFDDEKESLKKKEKKSKPIILVSYNEAPKHLQDNEYIRKGYLVNCDSMKKVTKSLFMIHNETVNVWSHLLGAILIIVLVVYTAIFITNYKTHLSNIKLDFEKLKSYTKPLLDIDNIQIRKYTSMILEYTSDIKNELKKKINMPKLYYIYLEKINQTFHLIKNSKNSNLNNFTISISDYLDLITEKISRMKNEIIQLMEIENLSFIQKSKSPLKRWPLFIMLSSAILCLLFSALFHLFGTMNKTTNKILSRFDYGGISLLIAGSCYPPYYYFFNCDIFLRNIYLIFISTFALIVFFFSLTSSFHLPEKRTLRGILFLSLGLSAGFPIVHLALMGNSVKGFYGNPRLLFWYFGGISYVIGALMYINRIPEKFKPGKFDFFGSSHQIFHVFVVFGVVFHYIGCLDAYYYRLENECKM